MNLVHSIIRRQEGFGLSQDYDIALYRLKCLRHDVFRGITPNTEVRDFPEPPIFTIRFCTTVGYEHILALANEDGEIALQNTGNTVQKSQILNSVQAHRNAIFDVAWMPNELKLVTTSGDHTARLWDVSRPEITQIQLFQGHTRSVKTAVFRHEDKAVFATGARDGAVMIWDIRANHGDNPRPDNCISNAHSTITTGTKYKKAPQSRSQSITGLAFQDDFTLLSCSAGDGLIKIWDLRKNYTVHKKDPIAKNTLNHIGKSARNGFTSLLICPSRTTLYASCMDNIIYAYNISSTNSKPFAEFYGHQNSTFYVKACLSPDGRYIGSGSSDESAYIWHTRRPGGPLVKLTGHSEEVTCIAWCSVGEMKIVTCSDDFTHRIWRVSYEYEIDNEEIEFQGKAVIVPSLDTQHASAHPNVEITPTSRNIISCVRTPASNTSSTGSSVKRTHDQMSNSQNWSGGKYKSLLSPIHENKESIAKRPHLEVRGARRLFSPATGDDSSTNKGCESDGTGSGAAVTDNCKKVLFSPTSNLPNFVVDGTAPHLLEMSPQKYKGSVDWLTKIREEILEQKSLSQSTLTPDKPRSPKLQSTPNCRTTSRRLSEPSKSIKCSASSLLNFFKVQASKDSQETKTSQSQQPTTSKSMI